MSWRVLVTSRAEKQLRRLPVDIRRRVGFLLDSLEEQPLSGDIEKLGGTADAWRRRVGSYRVKFRLLSEERIIYVYEIKRRTSSTY